jgi:hypothetical protein
LVIETNAPKQNKGTPMNKLIVSAIAVLLLMTANVQAADGDSYTCTIASIYRTGAGASVDSNNETFKFSISGDVLTITNSSGNKTENHDLKLQINNNYAAMAKNEGMIFSYRFGSGAFEWSTGIGESGFNRDQGHSGQQMRFAGTCAAD